MNTTIDLIRAYISTKAVTISGGYIVRLESTGQTLGMIHEGEETVTEHLKSVTEDNDNEWHGVESSTLYNEPSTLRTGLAYIGRTGDDTPVWYQSYDEKEGARF